MPAAMAAEQATERRQQPFLLAERIGTVLQRAVEREEAVAQRRIADAVAGEIGNLRQTETVGHRIERGFRQIERAIAPARDRKRTGEEKRVRESIEHGGRRNS